MSWCVSTWALNAISLALKWTILKGLGSILWDMSLDMFFLCLEFFWGMEPMSTLRADFAESAQRPVRWLFRGAFGKPRVWKAGARRRQKNKSQVFSCCFFYHRNFSVFFFQGRLVGKSWKFMPCFPNFHGDLLKLVSLEIHQGQNPQGSTLPETNILLMVQKSCTS